MIKTLAIFCTVAAALSAEPTATQRFKVDLPPPAAPQQLLPNSPFGVNTAFEPDTPDLDARLAAMQQAGIKWGRQDFTWKRIEKEKGKFDFEPYDRLLEKCRGYGIQLFGNLSYAPDFYDMATDEAYAAYAEFARAAATRYAGKIDHWQIWNEPNFSFQKGDPDHYAPLLASAGKAIHAANPKAKVLGMNMAFCDVIWAEKILKRVPYDCFDIICFHPYRNPNAPEEKYDWWMLDQYVKTRYKDLTQNYPLVKADVLDQTEALITTMKQFGQPKPIWITEMCFNTQIHPYGLTELRSANLTVRFHVLTLSSNKIEKIFWWTLKDLGEQQFDQAEMVGLTRADLTPKYSYYAYSFMTRFLEGKTWVRNLSSGPDVYACVFNDHKAKEDTIVAWTTRPTSYLRVDNDENGLEITDIFGTSRKVPYHAVRTKFVSIPLNESPLYIRGSEGLKAVVRPMPGW